MKILPAHLTFTSKIKNETHKVPFGVDYSEADSFILRSKSAIKEDIKNGKDVEDALDEFVLANIDTVLKDAKKTHRLNPDLSYDDLVQDALLRLVEYTRKAKESGKISDMSAKRAIKPKNGKQENMESFEMLDKNYSNSADLADVVMLEELPKKTEEVIDGLTLRQNYVMKRRFGLEDGIERSLKSIANEFGTTQEVIRNIEAKAFRRLRHPSRVKQLKDMMESVNDSKDKDI